MRAQEPQLSEIEVAATLKAVRSGASELDEKALRPVLAQWIEQIGSRPAPAVLKTRPLQS